MVPNSKSAFLTKILVPRRRPEVVRRERLLNALRAGSGSYVAIVRAPAGFGKTTLLVDLVHDTGQNVCWVSLDEWDSDPRVFLEYLQQAVLRSTGWKKGAEAGAEPRTALGELVTALAEAKGDTWIVLDDFQHLDGAPDVLRLVDELAVRLPDNCRLFLTTRTPPALPSLPRIRLQGRVIDIGPEELAFTREELRQYHRNTVGEEMSADEADRFLQGTQGWPAAVVLLTQTRGLAENAGPIEEYMAAEILARLPEDVQEFLLATSVLETLHADACDAVTGRSDAADILAQLERLNVPMLRLQSDTPEYRIHSLFGDFLRGRLQARSVGLYRELNAKAGEWLAAQGRTAEAVVQLANAEEWNTLADLIEREAPAAYRLGRWHMIMSWLHLLPAPQLAGRASLKLWEIRARVRIGQSDEALRELQKLELEREGLDPTVAAELEALRATALRKKGEAGASLESARKAVDLSIAANTSVESLMEARKQLGLALCASGLFAEALPELRAVLEFHARRGDEEECAFVNGVLGSALSAQGNLIEAIRHLELARQAWRRMGNASELSWMLNNLAVTYHRAGQIDLARESAEEGIRISREAGHQREEAFLIASLADIERTSGQIGRALELYGDARSMCEALALHGLMTNVLTGLAQARRALGQFDLAEVLVREALASAEDTGSQFEKGLALLALGQLQRAQERFEKATATLGEASALFDRVDAEKELAESLYYLADAAVPMRQGRGLVKLTLNRLAGIVTKLGYDDFLARACRESPAAVHYAAANNLGEGYYRRLLRRLAPPAAGRGGAVEIFALGGFRTKLDGREIMTLEWQSEKAKELFLLLVWSGRPLSREEIIVTLWPEADPQRVLRLFHTTVHRVRRALYREAIVESGGLYSPNPAGTFTLDAQRFLELTEAAASAVKEDGERARILGEALRLYNGPFGQGLKGEWLEEPRLRLEEKFHDVAKVLADALISVGRIAEAASVCEQALHYDPFREEMYARLMRAHAAAGDRESALRVYRRCADILERELNQEPGPEISRLYSELGRQPTGGGRRVS